MAKCPVCRVELNGDMRKVYANCECKYCCEVPEYIMAYPCGHWSCEPCLDKIIRTSYGVPALTPAPPPAPTWQSIWSITPYPDFVWHSEEEPLSESDVSGDNVIWAAKPVLYGRFFLFELINMCTGAPWMGSRLQSPPPAPLWSRLRSAPPAPLEGCTGAQWTNEGWQVYVPRERVPMNFTIVAS